MTQEMEIKGTVSETEARQLLFQFETFGLSYVEGGGTLIVRSGHQFLLAGGLGQAALTEQELAEALSRTIEIRGIGGPFDEKSRWLVVR